MLDSRQNLPSHLLDAALRYRARGWSVLPLRGAADPHNPKAPAVPWLALQRRHATPAELRGWFESGVGRGLGIVCGRVSRLAVLDLDDPEAARAFATSCPRLLDTLTVRSGGRGQPHHYFQVPESVQLRGARAPGVDLQFEGSYVLAPPTRFAGQQWRTTHDVEPLRLDQGGADDLLRFLDTWRLRCAGGPAAALRREPQDHGTLSPGVDALSLCGWYRRLARREGRNRALFRAASLARDGGWSEAQAVSALAAAHVVQPPSWSHAPETPAQRSAEARRTIASAWRRPRRWAGVAEAGVRGLPNALRERLLSEGQVALGRVLEGLQIVRVRGGRLLDERGMCQLLGPLGIGRRCVRQALQARMTGHAPVFKSPRNPPQKRACAATGSLDHPLKCESVRGAERVKRGRPPRLYRVPAMAALLASCKLADDGSDPLSPGDLVSARAWRCALHRALIARRPGCYSRRWLGARLGVSVWTCRRYDRRAGLKVQPRYLELQLDERQLERLPRGQSACDGRFLLSADGRRWPPLRSLATGLWRRYGRLRYLRQGWNHYELAPPADANALHKGPGASPRRRPRPLTPAQDAAPVHHRPGSPPGAKDVADRRGPQASRASPAQAGGRPHRQQAVNGATECDEIHNVPPERARQATAAMRYWHCAACGRGGFCDRTPHLCPACGAPEPESVAPEVWRDAARCQAWWQGRAGSDAEQLDRPVAAATDEPQRALARQLCQATRQLSRQHALSMATALQLLDEHGAAALRRALRLLQRRRDLRNPGGFVVSVIRGSRGNAQPERRSQEDWLAALRASPWAEHIET